MKYGSEKRVVKAREVVNVYGVEKVTINDVEHFINYVKGTEVRFVKKSGINNIEKVGKYVDALHSKRIGVTTSPPTKERDIANKAKEVMEELEVLINWGELKDQLSVSLKAGELMQRKLKEEAKLFNIKKR